MGRILSIWEDLRSSYWFVPLLMVAVASLLAFVIPALDGRIAEDGRLQRYIYGGGPAGAREVLSTIAGSIVTVAGTTFAITVASLSLASQQFGHRLLRNFMRDLGNQIVLGTFLGTFLYCILVLRTVRGLENDSFVPHLAVTVGVAFAVASLGMLIYFIHHISQGVQVSHVISVAARQLDEAVARIFPVDLDEGEGSGGLPAYEPTRVCARESGYVQTIDAKRALRLATDNGLVLQVLARPGDFVGEGEELAYVWPAATDQHQKSLLSALELGEQRTWHDDARFAFDQLAEVGVRALSTGINDPYTAMMVVDRLTGALRKLCQRCLPRAHYRDNEGMLRLVVPSLTYDELLSAALGELIWSARGMPSVLHHLERELGEVLNEARDPILARGVSSRLHDVEAALKHARSAYML